MTDLNQYTCRCPHCGGGLFVCKDAPDQEQKPRPLFPPGMPSHWRVRVERRLLGSAFGKMAGPANYWPHPSELPCEQAIAAAWGGGFYRLTVVEGYGPEAQPVHPPLEVQVEGERRPLKRKPAEVRAALEQLGEAGP